MTAGASEPNIFPASVLAGASKPLREDLDESRIWALAGNGWKAVLESRRNDLVQRHLGKLNTPKPENVDELFRKLIGLKDLSSCWSWKATSPAAARQRLERLIELRGEIAHRVMATKPVKKKLLHQSGDFVCRLAARSSNHVLQYVYSRTKLEPWIPVRYGTTG
jgi:hypothetical protein